jgi:hypothetical protein
MDINLQDAKDWYNSNMNFLIDKIAAKESFFESDEFFHYWKKIVEHVLWNDYLYEDDIRYETSTCVTYEQFIKVICSINISVPVYGDQDESIMYYGGMILTTICGMGCNTTICKHEHTENPERI